MTSNYLISFVVGLVFGAGYGFLNVKSPAPPIFALFGLLGMVVGEQGVPWAKQHFLHGQDRAAHTTSNPLRCLETSCRARRELPWIETSDGSGIHSEKVMIKL